ncbi:MAG: hypothetical protein AAFY38_10815 [Pseudomonadota bacterium]
MTAGRTRGARTPPKDAHTPFVGKAQCASCHQIGETSASFTDNAFHDTGYAAAKPAPSTSADLGLFAVTDAAADRFAFRTPRLRNVALTAPYMHDCGLRTLEEVVAFST